MLLAALGVAVAVVAVIALQNPKGRQASHVSTTASTSMSHASSPASAVSPSSTAGTSPTATSHPVPLIVLDNTGDPSLAGVATARFIAGGWTVTATNELQNDILSTVAYYDPSYPGAQQAALQLQQQFPAIKRVVPKFAELPTGPIVVVLTSDYH